MQAASVSTMSEEALGTVDRLPGEPRWPVARTVAFVAAASVGIWGGLAFLVIRLF